MRALGFPHDMGRREAGAHPDPGLASKPVILLRNQASARMRALGFSHDRGRREAGACSGRSQGPSRPGARLGGWNPPSSCGTGPRPEWSPRPSPQRPPADPREDIRNARRRVPTSPWIVLHLSYHLASSAAETLRTPSSPSPNRSTSARTLWKVLQPLQNSLHPSRACEGRAPRTRAGTKYADQSWRVGGVTLRDRVLLFGTLIEEEHADAQIRHHRRCRRRPADRPGL